MPQETVAYCLTVFDAVWPQGSLRRYFSTREKAQLAGQQRSDTRLEWETFNFVSDGRVVRGVQADTRTMKVEVVDVVIED